jgi:hypothetical protein
MGGLGNISNQPGRTLMKIDAIASKAPTSSGPNSDTNGNAIAGSASHSANTGAHQASAEQVRARRARARGGTPGQREGRVAKAGCVPRARSAP